MKTCIHCGYAAPGDWADCPACGQPVPQAPTSAPPPGGGSYPAYAPQSSAGNDAAYAQTVLNMSAPNVGGPASTPAGAPAGYPAPSAGAGQMPAPGTAPFPGGATPSPAPAATGSPPGPPQGYPAYGGGPSPANPYASPSSDVSGPVPYYNPAYEAMLPSSGKAIASLVLGILSIALIYFGLILGPLAIGFWASARKDLEEMPPRFKGKGMNTAGLVTGIIGTIIGVLIVAGIAFAVCAAERVSRGSY